MPVITCDPDHARARLEAEGIEVEPGNTAHERWRASHDGATAVAYDEKVVIQGTTPWTLTGLLEEHDSQAYLYFDGASHGNPGPAAVGWVIVTDQGIVAEGGERIGTATNNEAEYEALIRGLEAATSFGFNHLEVRGDSELVVRQIQGRYAVNAPHLQERRVRVVELLESFGTYEIEHVPRSVNERADELATEALDG